MALITTCGFCHGIGDPEQRCRTHVRPSDPGHAELARKLAKPAPEPKAERPLAKE